MWAAWIGMAMAAQVAVTPIHGAVHPGLPKQLLVAATDDAGLPLEKAPRIEVEGGSIRYESQVAPGIWSFVVVPPMEGSSVRFLLSLEGEGHTRVVPMQPLFASSLVVKRRIDGLAGAATIQLEVTGDDLPPAEALRVVPATGEVVSIETTDDHLLVTLAPGESRFPRFVPVGIYDARREEMPAWTGLRLRTRPRIALQTEKGTTLELSVGGRPYGPFVAGGDGVVAGVVDQYPGEMVAQAILTDDLGNQTTTELPLSSHTQPALVAVPTGPIVPGRPPPAVHLLAVHGDGHPWSGRPPTCRTSLVGDLEVIPVDKGTWLLSMRELRLPDPQDIRVLCSLGAGAETSFRIPVAEDLPTRMRLRVWPEELSNDFPIAEVQVVLENPSGERLPVKGVVVSAERGEVVMETASGTVSRGEYRGDAAIDAGGDKIHARYERPRGGVFVAGLDVGHGEIAESGEVEIYGRALDATGRPVEGVELVLSAGTGPAFAVTDADGWARTTLPLPDGLGPVVLEARDTHHAARRVALRQTSAVGGPGTALLSATHSVSITAGRVTEMFLTVDPPVLYTGAGSVAFVRVTVVDRAGSPVLDADVDLIVTEGTLGPVRPTGEGGYVAEYTPPPGERAREVMVSGTVESATATGRLLLEPRPVERAPGIAVGIVSNFGRVTSPAVSLDFDWRTPWFGRSVMLRIGVATWGANAEVDTGFGEKVVVRTALYPASVGLLGRREIGARALWLGIGGVLALHHTRGQFGSEVAVDDIGVLPPGLELIGGMAQRFRGGEVMLELRALTLSNPGGDVAFQGPMGGLGAFVGYRLTY